MARTFGDGASASGICIGETSLTVGGGDTQTGDNHQSKKQFVTFALQSSFSAKKCSLVCSKTV